MIGLPSLKSHISKLGSFAIQKGKTRPQQTRFEGVHSNIPSMNWTNSCPLSFMDFRDVWKVDQNLVEHDYRAFLSP